MGEAPLPGSDDTCLSLWWWALVLFVRAFRWEQQKFGREVPDRLAL